MYNILLLLITFFFLSGQNIHADYFPPVDFIVRRNQGHFIDHQNSYSTTEFLAYPYHYENLWSFFDLRYHYFDSGDFASNLGLGMRFAPEEASLIFGIHVFYDYRHAYHRGFKQLGFGWELLGSQWSCRLNGYLPVGKREILDSSCLFDEYGDGLYVLQENFIKSSRGIQFEVETLLSNLYEIDIYLGVGTYFYKGANKCQGNIYGTEYRLSVQPHEYFTFRISVTNDNRFKTNVQGQIVFSLPLNLQQTKEAVLFQPFQRYDTILLDKHSRWTWNF